jgi:AcrR family transcriptional regulator
MREARLGGREKIRARTSLTATDWAQAALAVIGEAGLAAVAVEPIAVRLGTTKGSFYWHFKNRRALLEAAMQLWERERTEAVIDAMEAEPNPRQRLRRLFVGAVEMGLEDRTEMTLLASATDPMVAPVLQRVTERRVTYLAKLFRDLGLSTPEARSRALLAYNAFVGYLQLAHVSADVLPVGPRERKRYLEDVLAALMSATGPAT